MITEKIERRFWAKVDKSGECWEWIAAKDHKGYGRFNIRTDGVSFIHRAHRVAYLILVGSIPDGIQIDHRCHNKSCVRPDHLRRATNKQNHENLRGPNANSTSGIRGVYWDKRAGRWVARIVHASKVIHVGSFRTASEAESAAIAKRNELFTHNDADRLEAHGIRVGS